MSFDSKFILVFEIRLFKVGFSGGFFNVNFSSCSRADWVKDLIKFIAELNQQLSFLPAETFSNGNRCIDFSNKRFTSSTKFCYRNYYYLVKMFLKILKII